MCWHNTGGSAEVEMNDQERMGSWALPGCSAIIDIILALIYFLFSAQDKLKKHEEMGESDVKLKTREGYDNDE